jgi:hypothetical protein
MPLYFFNVYNDDVTLDDEGAELVDDEAARARGIKEVRALAAETVAHGHFFGHHRIEVTDADLRVIATIRFDEAVEVRD